MKVITKDGKTVQFRNTGRVAIFQVEEGDFVEEVISLNGYPSSVDRFFENCYGGRVLVGILVRGKAVEWNERFFRKLSEFKNFCNSISSEECRALSVWFLHWFISNENFFYCLGRECIGEVIK